MLLPRRGHHDHRDAFRPRIGLDPAENLEPVHLRELQVEEHDLRCVLDAAVRVRAGGEQELQRGRPVADVVNLVSQVLLPQRPQRELGVRRAVLDEQNLHSLELHAAFLLPREA